MVRFRVLALALAAMMVVGVSAAIACDGAKTQQASAEKSCSQKASVEKASAEKASSCASKATAEVASAGKSCASKATAEVASAGKSCASKATAEVASAGKSCASKAAVEVASAGKSCSKADVAMASEKCQYLCDSGKASFAKMAPFAFMNEAKEVAVGVEPTETGFAFVFAGENEATVDKAVALANKSMTMMQKPAACSATRSAMAQKAGGCDVTEACLTALADCEISVVKTETGARTVIAGSDEAKVAALHGFLTSTGYGPAEKTAGE